MVSPISPGCPRGRSSTVRTSHQALAVSLEPGGEVGRPGSRRAVRPSPPVEGWHGAPPYCGGLRGDKFVRCPRGGRKAQSGLPARPQGHAEAGPGPAPRSGPGRPRASQGRSGATGGPPPPIPLPPSQEGVGGRFHRRAWSSRRSLIDSQGPGLGALLRFSQTPRTPAPLAPR